MADTSGYERGNGMNGLTKVLLFLSIIGAINWGLIGFFNWNLVNAIFGGSSHETSSALSRIIYAIVGLSGLGLLFVLPRLREVRSLGARRASPTLTDRRTEVRP